jgi:hypothetical protein
LKRYLILIGLLILVLGTGCYPGVNDFQINGAIVTGDIVVDPGITIDGVDISTIGGASHAQNTDTHLTSDGITIVIDAGVITRDLYTDRWIYNNSNTIFGVDAAGSGALAHTAGEEGWYNTFFGNNAGKAITKGYRNVFIGSDAGTRVTTGFYNAAIGDSTLSFLTTGSYSAALGYQALSNSTGSYNTAVGPGALANSGAGTYNTAVGLQSMNSATGSRNTAVGRWTGQFNTGSDNVFLGNEAGENSGAVSNKLYIDNSDTATPLIAGDFSTNTVTINNDLEVTGDLYFPTAGGGLPYGCMHLDALTDVTCTLQNTWYQVPFDHAYISNLTTLSAANDDITIIKTGVYLISYSYSRHTHFAHDYEWNIRLNNGTVETHANSYSTSLGVGKIFQSSHATLYNLTAGDTVELWVRCIDAAGMVVSIDKADILVTMIGR